MDSITHIALGACMGEAFAGKQLGKKAMLWGALAQSIPDIDFVASFWMDIPSSLLAHRGFTHSILFCFFVSFLLALIAEYWHKPHRISLFKWFLFFCSAVFVHIFLDAFNNYGVGWFEPFSHQRITFNTIYVADPFFSVWPGLALLALLYFRHQSERQRSKYWMYGLGISAFYLVYCLINKSLIDRDLRKALDEQQISYTRYFTTPAPLQNWLWYVVAGDDNGYYVGFRSLFDSSTSIDFQYFQRNDSLLKPVQNHSDLHNLIRFSQEFYTVENHGDSLIFNDLRFGQIVGWQNPQGKFVFHYYLDKPEANELVVQRGRFEGWNIQTAKALLERIKGN